jgi:hypothetical protein
MGKTYSYVINATSSLWAVKKAGNIFEQESGIASTKPLYEPERWEGDGQNPLFK